MKRTNIYIPEISKMYDATVLPVVGDYGFGDRKQTHAVITEGGRILRMTGIPALSENGIVGTGDMGIQMTRVLELVKLTVERAGGTWDDIIYITTYFTDRKQFHEKGLPARWAFFKKHSKTGIPPCSTGILVAGLHLPEMMVEIDATAVLP